MRKAVVIIALVLESLNIYAQSPTLLGTHGSNSPQILQNLDVQIARYGFTDYDIKNGITNESTDALDKARTLDALNIEQVVHLTWPDTTSINEYERIPIGADSIEVFQYLDTLIDEMGTYIEYIQISQEPFGASSYNPEEEITNVIKWWKAVALFIRNKQALNPDDLGHIKLITGGITGFPGALNNPDSEIASLIDSVIVFGENYCDAIDLHLHIVDITMGESFINYVKSRTNHPLSCTEWSQAKAVTSSGTNWINAINTAFYSPHPFADLTNDKIIRKAYLDRMDSAEWNMLIATSPYTPNFIYDFYAVMERNCFEMACYAGVFQFNAPKFDWNQLIASKTVIQELYPNNPFYKEFTGLSSTLQSGFYSTNCSITSIDDRDIKPTHNSVYPNPFNDFTTIKFDNPTNQLYTLKLFNSLGKNVRVISNISTGKIIIRRNNLKSGVYSFQLQSGSKVYASGKLVIE
ncbi:MAG: T9SS type A sorting domain-containing protein [Cyclobacteriaceae bacterium]|nr:T9SS type A sorting domain-containing protein [Cyclobacteriaceae bacterium]